MATPTLPIDVAALSDAQAAALLAALQARLPHGAGAAAAAAAAAPKPASTTAPAPTPAAPPASVEAAGRKRKRGSDGAADGAAPATASSGSVQWLDGKRILAPGDRRFDMSVWRLRHVALHVAYLGGAYHGFASQDPYRESAAAPARTGSKGGGAAASAAAAAADTMPPPITVEGAVFGALQQACLIPSREGAGYSRCGRTDRGVSAGGQIMALRLRSRARRSGDSVDDGGSWVRPDGLPNGGAPFPAPAEEHDYALLLNNLLPPDIRVLGWADVGPDFSARFSASLRTYRYFFTRRDLDLAAMANGAARLVGVHDFRNFAKIDITAAQNFTREVLSARIVRAGSAHAAATAFLASSGAAGAGAAAAAAAGTGDDGGSEETYYLEVKGRAFLWHQVRCMAAVLFLVGRRLEAPSIVDYLLDIAACPARPQYTMAPEAPLCLQHCGFGEEHPYGGAGVTVTTTRSSEAAAEAADGGDSEADGDSVGSAPMRFVEDPALWSRMYASPAALAKLTAEWEARWSGLCIDAALLRSLLDRVAALPVTPPGSAAAADVTPVPWRDATTSRDYSVTGVAGREKVGGAYVPLASRPVGMSVQETWEALPQATRDAIAAQHPINTARMLRGFAGGGGGGGGGGGAAGGSK